MRSLELGRLVLRRDEGVEVGVEREKLLLVPDGVVVSEAINFDEAHGRQTKGNTFIEAIESAAVCQLPFLPPRPRAQASPAGHGLPRPPVVP